MVSVTADTRARTGLEQIGGTILPSCPVVHVSDVYRVGKIEKAAQKVLACAISARMWLQIM